MAALSSSFERDRHVRFLQMMMEGLPSEYEGQDVNRLTLAYFAISGLGILRALDQAEKQRIIDWVLSLQVLPSTAMELDDGTFYGFLGCSNSKFLPSNSGISSLNTSNLASTYCALAILKTIGYNLADIKHEYISKSIGCLQQSDGSFIPVDIGGERDLRFVYCAASICHVLNDWSCLNIKKAKDFIISCQSYDGGFGLTPGSESHGGATYCAVAALRLMGFIPDDPISSFAESCPINLPMLLEWLLHRQAVDGGFQGRANKASDTCYAFWVGGVLTLLGASNLFNKDSLCKFLHSCQFKYGGFSKHPGEYPDLYHSYFGYSAFSLLEEPGLDAICVELGITVISALGTSNM